MGHPAQTGFNTAQNHRDIPICTANQVAIYHGRMIGTPARASPWCIGIALPPSAGHIIMIHHGIHIACTDQKPQPGPAKYRDAFRRFPVRLGDDPHPIPVGFQQPGNDGMSERRMIHIGVSRHINKIHLLPSPAFHFCFRNR